MSIAGYTSLLIYTSVLLFILGTVFGSFIDCVAGRIVAGENWIKGRSHCEHCGHALEAIDLIPIVSYLMTGGKCRYCHKKITVRYLIIEVLMGAVFVGAFLSRKTLDLRLVRDLILCVLLMGLSLVDYDTYTIPDGFIIAGIVNWLVFSLVSFNKSEFFGGLIAGAVIGGFVLGLSLIMDKILKKESLGGGDIKLLFMVSLYFGPLSSLFLVFFSCIIGLIFVVLFKRGKIPFGPSISIATVLMIMYGEKLLSFYIHLF